MSQKVEVILDDQGRLVIPAPLHQQLGLSRGITLVVEQETEDAAVLRIQGEQPRLVDKQGVLVVQSRATGDIATEVRNERQPRSSSSSRISSIPSRLLRSRQRNTRPSSITWQRRESSAEPRTTD